MAAASAKGRLDQGVIEAPPVGAPYPRHLFTAGVNGTEAAFEWREEWLEALGG